jgi:hypothetical protein
MMNVENISSIIVFIYLIDKIYEPEKSTGPSGVIPIAVLKMESIVKYQ